MYIDDFVMLGRTEPSTSKKYGMVVCSAGYRKTTGEFIRIYPLLMTDRIPQWSVCSMELTKNPQDSREESWKLPEDASVEITGKVKKDDQYDFLRSFRSHSIAECNERRTSLAILEPRNLRWRFNGLREREELQSEIFPDISRLANDKMVPRFMFQDNESEHNLQYLEWGASEFLRKNPTKKHQLWDALQLTKTNYEHLLFVGNHAIHRNSWLVINKISRKFDG